ncbi:MAG: His-Xaa-Ser system protein HxsD [bacterium]|nr:His-Xaa-Ser system protein HxsD [bacterium]
MNKILFSLNSKITSLEALYSACYVFIDKFYIYLDKKGENFIVSLQPKTQVKADPRKVEGEFRNELLNSLLREKITGNNSKIREYIIGQALYSSVPSEIDEFLSKTGEDYQEDPLGIAIPWEEKAKKRAKAGKARKKAGAK